MSLGAWRAREEEVPGDVALVALVGSHAYGTNREGSDFDYRGLYVAPTERLFRLDGVLETFDRQEPDLTLHEVGKFMRLAAAANPTVLECLWADAERARGGGLLLRENRQLFLSRRVLRTYMGYATQQLQKAIRGVGGSRGVQHFKRDKFLMHTYRLMYTGISILETGDLTLRVEDPEALWAKARQPLERIQAEFLSLEARVRGAADGSPLPEHPDMEAINGLLVRIRLDYL